MLQYESVRSVQRVCARRWWMALQLVFLLSWATSVYAHDLAIDQVMLWPDRTTQQLRGELTFDPELTRSKDESPSPQAAQRVLEFLAANVRVTLDGRTLPIRYELRELWVRGGATLGDLVVFSAPLPESSSELRVFASGFKALVVSVQVPGERYRTETTSWLLGPAEWTPAYQLGVGGQQSGWKAGGPEAFVDSSGALFRGQGPVPLAAPREDASKVASPVGLAGRFIRLGFEHILPQGVDHMLFVAGVVLGNVRRYRRVLVSLTLFTLAHTLTLALSNLLAVRLPATVVEPLIALSICWLGVDNLRARTPASGSDVGRQLLVFGFGLIHGLGFANALTELSFDREQLVLALFSFNLGVELGQIAVVALLALVLYWIRDPHRLRRYVTFPGSLAIAASGLFLVIERAGSWAGALRL
jgi:HupE / UreJ protein